MAQKAERGSKTVKEKVVTLSTSSGLSIKGIDGTIWFSTKKASDNKIYRSSHRFILSKKTERARGRKRVNKALL